ncbi:MAG: hypothetical protein U9R08_02850 [Nanoarchaeota archaeon]|nr:hypothetical protein [Nanoarchaeota archaeon]
MTNLSFAEWQKQNKQAHRGGYSSMTSAVKSDFLKNQLGINYPGQGMGMTKEAVAQTQEMDKLLTPMMSAFGQRYDWQNPVTDRAGGGGGYTSHADTRQLGSYATWLNQQMPNFKSLSTEDKVSYITGQKSYTQSAGLESKFNQIVQQRQERGQPFGMPGGLDPQLAKIRGQRSDLAGLYNEQGQAINPNDPKVKGIPTLQDWWSQYGQKEYPGINIAQQGTKDTETTGPRQYFYEGKDIYSIEDGKARYVPHTEWMNEWVGQDKKLMAKPTGIEYLEERGDFNLGEPGQADQDNIEDTLNTAVDAINNNAQGIFDSINDTGVGTSDFSSALKGLTDKIKSYLSGGDDTKKPVSMTDLLASQKADLGIDVLESDLANVDSQIEQMQTAYLVESDVAEGSRVSLREIQREKGALQKTAEREIAFLNIQKSAISRELNNKYTSLEMVMNTTQQDFQNASNYYKDNFNNALTLYNILKGEEAQAMDIAERAKTTARANLTVVQNAIVSGNLDYAGLTSDQKLKINQMEVQAGLFTGFTEKLMTENPGATIKTTNSRTDASGMTYFDVLMVDPDGSMSVETIARGTSRIPGSGINTEITEDGLMTTNFTIKSTGEVINISSVKGIKRLREIGDYSRTELYAFLDERTKLSATSIDDMLDEAGFPKEGKQDFLTKEYLLDSFGEDSLKESAKEQGFTKGGFLGMGKSADVEAYLNEILMPLIEQYREQGYTDKQIFKMITE